MSRFAKMTRSVQVIYFLAVGAFNDEGGFYKKVKEGGRAEEYF
jgi:hypothetical protein